MLFGNTVAFEVFVKILTTHFCTSVCSIGEQKKATTDGANEAVLARLCFPIGEKLPVFRLLFFTSSVTDLCFHLVVRRRSEVIL